MSTSGRPPPTVDDAAPATPSRGGSASPGPDPAVGRTPPVTVELEARDGARLVYPYATSNAAMMTSAVGTLSGDAVLEIEATCKPKQ